MSTFLIKLTSLRWVSEQHLKRDFSTLLLSHRSFLSPSWEWTKKKRVFAMKSAINYSKRTPLLVVPQSENFFFKVLDDFMFAQFFSLFTKLLLCCVFHIQLNCDAQPSWVFVMWYETSVKFFLNYFRFCCLLVVAHLTAIATAALFPSDDVALQTFFDTKIMFVQYYNSCPLLFVILFTQTTTCFCFYCIFIIKPSRIGTEWYYFRAFSFHLDERLYQRPSESIFI